MNELLLKLIRGEKVEDKDIDSVLTKICENQHASCNEACPIYAANGNKVPLVKVRCFSQNKMDCQCFKNGAAMRSFLIQHYMNQVDDHLAVQWKD